MDIKKLRQKKAEALAAAKAISETAATAGLDLTAEQRTQFDAHMETATDAQADIARAEALLEMERTAPAADGTGVIVGKNNNEDAPWGSLSEQLTAIRQHAVTAGRVADPRLFASLGANETVDTEGGWEVAPQFSNTLLTRTFEDPDVVSRCDVMPMSSSILRLNGMADNDRSTAAGRFAGIQVYRMGEGKPYTASKPKYRRIELNANKLGALFYATEELLADGPAIQNRVNTLVPKALAYQLADEVFAGTGEGEFLGIQTSGAQVVVPKDAGQQAETVSTSNILNIWNALFAPSRRTSVWYVQQDLESQLDQLVLGSGTAVELLYTPVGANGNNGPYALLKGRPVIPVEQAASVGMQGDLMLYDMEEYLIGDRQSMRFDSSMHVAFLTGEMAFRWMLRNDGQPKWDKPVTPRNSTQLRSPFVTLAARQ